ncbi:MAG: EF-P lysine aminoacylase GenX [Pseudomonadales bacterium]|nr:EF-P lysine aminoacylase GenX [Pseudomonadales bacterium]
MQAPPGDTQALLARRARFLRAIRSFFDAQAVTEVTTPQMGAYPASDPQLCNFRVDNPLAVSDKAAHFYLQTSPESAMKQLLARGSGSIYQLCQAFRVDPPGALHAMEFTLLEWYRLGFDFDEIISDTLSLVATLLGDRKVEVISYFDIFLRELSLDPLLAGKNELRDAAKRRVDVDMDDVDEQIWLDLLFSHCIAPQLGQGCYTVIRDFPPQQAAMAELAIDAKGNQVAARFELFIEGVEIANGYKELSDWREQQRRFEQDNKTRQARGIAPVEIDKGLLASMREHGLPACAGVALGVDRLLMLAQ